MTIFKFYKKNIYCRLNDQTDTRFAENMFVFAELHEVGISGTTPKKYVMATGSEIFTNKLCKENWLKIFIINYRRS